MKWNGIANGSSSVSENLELRKMKISGGCCGALSGIFHARLHLSSRYASKNTAPKESGYRYTSTGWIFIPREKRPWKRKETQFCWYCCIVDKVVLEKCLLIDIVVMSAFFLRFMVGMGRGWKRWLHSESCCVYSLCIRWCTVPWLRVLL